MFIWCWTTTVPTRRRWFMTGWPADRTSTCTSPPPVLPGSTKWNAGSRPSPRSRSDAAAIAAPARWKRRSRTTWPFTTRSLSHSSGPKAPIKSLNQSRGTVKGFRIQDTRRGSARVHAGGAVQLPVARLLRPARRGGAGQQPVGWRLRVRATGHPRAGEDAVARQHGADDHAGDGPGAHPGRPARGPAESGQTRLTGDRRRSPPEPNPIGSSESQGRLRHDRISNGNCTRRRAQRRRLSSWAGIIPIIFGDTG